MAYDELSGRRTTEKGIGAQVSFSAREQDVVDHANQDVQVAYAENRIAEAKDEVISLVDAGRQEDAAARLESVSSSLGVMAKLFGNSRVERLAAPAAVEAERVKKEGLDNVTRKAYRADNAQTVNQQTRD